MKIGTQVKVNGTIGRVIEHYGQDMSIVRVFDGFRHVGDVCIDNISLEVA